MATAAQEESKLVAQNSADNRDAQGILQSFKMIDPVVLKETLTRGLGPKIDSIM